MKKIILVILLVSIELQGCTDEISHDSLNGSWTVFSFQNLATGTTEFRTQENSWNKNITVQFDVTGNPKTISGKNTTNNISGEFNYVGENQFQVSNLQSTYVNQPRWAFEFITAITSQDLTFEIIDDTLVISYDNKSKSVALKRE